jgi:Domain of unknown function (DUF1877)
MGIVCRVLGLTPSQIEALRATPSLANSVVMATMFDAGSQMARLDAALQRMPPERRAQFEERRAQIQAQFEAQSRAAMASSPLGERMAAARDQIAALGPIEQALDLEKIWYVLHYAYTGGMELTGTPADLLLTGEELGEDMGYGPPRLHGPEATRDFSRFLEAQDLAQVQARVDIEVMHNLGLPGVPMGRGPTAEDEEDLREAVGHYFRLLRDHVRSMSEKGYGLLTWTS